MPTQSQIRDEVTARIIQALEADLLPWRRPWSSGSTQPGRHSNVATKRPYQGVNHILLELHAQQHSLFSRWWGTFPMWKSLGCNIRKRPQNVQEGCWGCRIVFYKPVTKMVVDDQTGDEDEERFFVLRTFTVFAADQVDGDAAEESAHDRHEGQTNAQPDFQPAEELILATGADIRFGGNRAYYSRPIAGGRVPEPHQRRLHRPAATGDIQTRRGHSMRPLSTRLPTGAKSAPAGITTRRVTPWANWQPKSLQPTSAPNLESRRAKILATTPPT